MMKIYENSISIIKGERGAVAILVGISMLTLVGFTALAVDVGYMMTTRNELQNIADAAALAAARELGDIYQKNNAYDNSTDRPDILKAAVLVAKQNKAGELEGIDIKDEDLEIGDWDGSTFTASTTLPNAVRATTRRDGGANGPITTFFFNILGVDSVDINAQAIAALSAQRSAEDVGPIGISKKLFEYAFCDQPMTIRFREDRPDCAGWHTFDELTGDPVAAIDEIIQDGIADGTFGNHRTQVNDEFVFTGEPVWEVFPAMEAFYTENNVDGILELNVAVFDNGDQECGNPDPSLEGTTRQIVGFATLRIEGLLVDEIGHKIIGKIICQTAEDGRGAGIFSTGDLSYGTMGNIPSLVK
jgi:hypothetical protein